MSLQNNWNNQFYPDNFNQPCGDNPTRPNGPNSPYGNRPNPDGFGFPDFPLNLVLVQETDITGEILIFQNIFLKEKLEKALSNSSNLSKYWKYLILKRLSRKLCKPLRISPWWRKNIIMLKGLLAYFQVFCHLKKGYLGCTTISFKPLTDLGWKTLSDLSTELIAIVDEPFDLEPLT